LTKLVDVLRLWRIENNFEGVIEMSGKVKLVLRAAVVLAIVLGIFFGAVLLYSGSGQMASSPDANIIGMKGVRAAIIFFVIGPTLVAAFLVSFAPMADVALAAIVAIIIGSLFSFWSGIVFSTIVVALIASVFGGQGKEVSYTWMFFVLMVEALAIFLALSAY